MNFNRISAVAATAFAVTLPFSLLACSESNPTNSSVTDSSELPATPCTAENEGQVEKVTFQVGSTRLDFRPVDKYFRCEHGSWVQRERWLSCNAPGVQIGDACEFTSCGANCIYEFHSLYTYAGDGIWNYVEGCDSDSHAEADKVKSFFVGTGTERVNKFYKCENIGIGRTWRETNFADYSCSAKNLADKDTCVLEIGGEKHYYLLHITDPDYPNLTQKHWEEAPYDPVLGFCSFNDGPKYGVKDGRYYYCKYNEWVEKDMIPRQYTDSRKEGLSDDEYDILDLPKNAVVGDLAGGLLENCYYGIDYNFSTNFSADMCVSQRYYRYSEDGSWALQSEDELNKAAKSCTPEMEGLEITVLPTIPKEGQFFPWPGIVYQCVSGKSVFKDFAFSRYIRTDKGYYGKVEPDYSCPVQTSTCSVHKYTEVDGKYFYCQCGGWVSANLVPRQYTDPRKEGLTDAEYDVLDLPKEASVGDRVGGLIENCWNDQDFGSYGTYDYCVSVNYYIYREDGTWTLETGKDEFARVSERDQPYCTKETLGHKYEKIWGEYWPSVVYECTYDSSGTNAYNESEKYGYKIVEYVFSNYRKKD